jgi:hypothetical protein
VTDPDFWKKVIPANATPLQKLVAQLTGKPASTGLCMRISSLLRANPRAEKHTCDFLSLRSRTRFHYSFQNLIICVKQRLKTQFSSTF